MNRRDCLSKLSAVAAGSLLAPRWAAAAEPSDLIRVPMSDGASIAVETGGAGPSVLFVHGAGTSRRSWTRVVPLLRPRFRTYAMDRRGHGDSTDIPPYSLQREAQDIAQVVDALPAPVFLVGHSFGAVAALEALRLTSRIGKAVLYEPPLPVPGGTAAGDPGPVCDAVATGDNDRAMMIFFRDYARLPQPVIDAFRADPMWSQRIGLAPATCREVTALAGYAFERADFAKVVTPTLLLLGGASPKPMGVSVRAAAAALAHSRTELLPGQQHVAAQTAPDLLAAHIAGFLAA